LNFYSGFVQDREEKLLENIAIIKQSKENRSTSKPKIEDKSKEENKPKKESKSKTESKNASAGNGTDASTENGKDEKYIEDMQELLQVVSFDAWMDEYKAYKIQILNARSNAGNI